MMRSTLQPRAFMMIDALIGLSIVATLALLLTIAVGRKTRAQQRLADLRDANRVAERVLLNLQHHQPLPELSPTRIQMHPIEGDAPAGFVWKRVDVSVRGSRAILYGIVPAQGGTP